MPHEISANCLCEDHYAQLVYWLTYYKADPNKQLLPRIAAAEPSKPPPVLFPTQFVASLPENFLNG